MEISTGAAVTVMFKSRNRKSCNIRSSSNTNDDVDDNNDSESNSGVLQNAQELKLEQQMRKRKMGVDPVDIKASKQHEYHRQNELHKQFNSTNNDANISLSDGIAHEKLMEQYVEEKLGLKHLKGGNNNSSTTTIDDELYRVPDLLKSLTSSTSQGNDKISDNIGLTSVVEVDLPSSYKLRNIRETEVAIKSSQGTVAVNKNKTMPHSRFENHYDSNVVDLDLDAIKNEQKGSTTNTVSSFAMREEDKISFDVESSEATVTSFK